MDRTIKNWWEDFQSKVIPDEAPDVQHQGMQTAFYAGALAVMAIMQRTGLEDPSPGEATALIDGLVDECVEFFGPDSKVLQ